MFEKVLIAEDYESASISVQRSLKDLEVKKTHFTHYCDDAYNLVQKSIAENQPFDLLITDLSFEEDGKIQKLKSGNDLIKEVRKIAPDLKILVFSSEKRPQIIKALFDDFSIDGFVSKGRLDVQDLKKAIGLVYKGEKYISQDNIVNMRKRDNIELSSLQFHILTLISEGLLQKNISDALREKNIKPNGQSTIEKTINQLKESFGAKSNEHLIAICKDMGIL